MKATGSTLDPAEVERFAAHACELVGSRRQLRPLHQLNPTAAELHSAGADRAFRPRFPLT
jgi:2-polyprenyl-3-methyl-5-hydroxy-6-metoxy-1,4-benzoquinol methylase